jgi:hypothetical protein
MVVKYLKNKKMNHVKSGNRLTIKNQNMSSLTIKCMRSKMEKLERQIVLENYSDNMINCRAIDFDLGSLYG